MAYEARCHCGAVRVNVETDVPSEAIVCNCSHCSIKALVLAAAPAASVRVVSGDEALTTYQFGRRVIDHRFCAACGTQVLSQGAGPDGTPMAMINLRSVPDLDLEQIEKKPFDGASF